VYVESPNLEFKDASEGYPIYDNVFLVQPFKQVECFALHVKSVHRYQLINENMIK